MKLLLDENLPKRLKKDFPEHEVFTARERRWNGIKNGELLQLMISDGFDALLTFDKNLQHQQNFSTYSIAALVLTGCIPNPILRCLRTIGCCFDYLRPKSNLKLFYVDPY